MPVLKYRKTDIITITIPVVSSPIHDVVPQ
jgi:hypothetical protein